MVFEERYAAEPMLTLEQIAKETGRTLATVRTHYERRRWKDRRIAVQAKTRAAIQAKLQQRVEKFALVRQSLLLTIARRGLKALAANLKAAGGEHGFGVEKVDGYQLQAMLKAYDDTTVEGKIAEQLTPILYEVMDRAATEQLTQQKLAEFRSRMGAPPSRDANGTTASTPKPTCANGRVASLFSRPSGTS